MHTATRPGKEDTQPIVMMVVTVVWSTKSLIQCDGSLRQLARTHFDRPDATISPAMFMFPLVLPYLSGWPNLDEPRKSERGCMPIKAV